MNNWGRLGLSHVHLSTIFVFTLVLPAMASATVIPQAGVGSMALVGDVQCIFQGGAPHPVKVGWIIPKQAYENGMDPMAVVPGGPDILLEPIEEPEIRLHLTTRRVDVGREPMAIVEATLSAQAVQNVSTIPVLLNTDALLAPVNLSINNITYFLSCGTKMR